MGRLVLFAGHNSICDWLCPQPELNNETVCVFISSFLGGINNEASIILQISGFETFGSIVPNTVARDGLKSRLLSADSFTHQWTTCGLHMHLRLYPRLILRQE